MMMEPSEKEKAPTFLSNTQKIYMAEWHAVASLVFGITIPFIVVEWSQPKAKKKVLIHVSVGK